MNDKLMTSTKPENRLRFIGKYCHSFGNFSCSNWEKRYFLALGMIPVTGVGYIGRKMSDGVVILCVNRSHRSFILYRIVKRHSRQSNVRRIWTCADND